MLKRSAFTIFKSVVIALFLREVQTRFGSRRLGYFWALFDAMFLVLIFAGLKSVLSKHSMHGIDYPVFISVSFLAFFLWKKIVSSSIGAFSANSALFAYKQVKPFDTIFTRVLLEIFVSIMATLVFIAIGLYFQFNLHVQNFNMLILAILWLILFGFSIGLMSAVFSHYYETFGKMVKIILTPLLFISAIMYTVDSLPPIAREIILYNPLVHFMEMIHGYYFITLDTRYVDYEYIFYWTIIPLYIGLYFYVKGERGILST